MHLLLKWVHETFILFMKHCNKHIHTKVIKYDLQTNMNRYWLLKKQVFGTTDGRDIGVDRCTRAICGQQTGDCKQHSILELDMSIKLSVYLCWCAFDMKCIECECKNHLVKLRPWTI